MPPSGQIYPPDLLDLIEAHDIGEWGGTVWRHMFADLSPSQVNVKGARWNPSSVGAIYTSLSRETALAEADYMIAMQPRRPRVERKLYTLQVTVERVVDLTDQTELAALGVSAETIGGINMAPCRYVGEMVSWLGFGGLLVPSARHAGSNLVIYDGNLGERFEFEVRACDVIPATDAAE